ncbi:hypothetical protein Cyrtocomes_01048 [Candidatus Cyrtobacter comes]|uniref:Outer membrane protein beta-barrel domain-containing protein n=1 Tax=Candidatus Cyrtobacter comes TaxID=675776 RepID=A0ABU5L952_9RICK|nr:hypothetical protein [Candidatus Cyrtobacter comes]MDZ5762657.1 hypothetical protein [Candidatus Cyrtobacter comes]
MYRQIFVLMCLSSQAGYASYTSYIGMNCGAGISGKIGNYELFKDDSGQIVSLKGKNLKALFMNAFWGVEYGNFGCELEMNASLPSDYKDHIIVDNNRGQSIFQFTQKSNLIGSAFANIFLKVSLVESLHAYLSGGIGSSYYNVGDMNVGDKTSSYISHRGSPLVNKAFAWNIGCSIKYNLSEHISINLISYKYYALGTFNTMKNTEDGSILSANMNMHQVSTGLVFEY